CQTTALPSADGHRPSNADSLCAQSRGEALLGAVWREAITVRSPTPRCLARHPWAGSPRHTRTGMCRTPRVARGSPAGESGEADQVGQHRPDLVWRTHTRLGHSDLGTKP